jgi:hypothetical protein
MGLIKEVIWKLVQLETSVSCRWRAINVPYLPGDPVQSVSDLKMATAFLALYFTPTVPRAVPWFMHTLDARSATCKHLQGSTFKTAKGENEEVTKVGVRTQGF